MSTTDVTGEQRINLCGQGFRAAAAIAGMHGVRPDITELNKNVQGVYKLQEQESFTKRNAKLIKALIIISAILLVGILALVAMNKAKSREKANRLEDAKAAGKDITQSDVVSEVTKGATATGSTTADSLISMSATTATVVGTGGTLLCLAGLANNASKQKHMGEVMEDFMNESLKQTARGKLALQNEGLEKAQEMYNKFINNYSNLEQSKAEQMIRQIDRGGRTGQISVAEKTFSRHDVEATCERNNPYLCGKKNLYDNYDTKSVSTEASSLNLKSLGKINLINYD